MLYVEGMVYIPRLMAKELKESVREYPVTALLGPRQSGKTTLAKKIFPHKEYVSMEDLDKRQFALQDPRGFLDTFKSGAVIDEVQRVPELLSYIQTKVDRERKKGRFILTGSNQFLLEEKITQSLAGRVSLLRLLPLSLQELAPYGKTENLFEVIFKGFYPKLYGENIRPARWLDNYRDTYINKEVRLVRNIGNSSQFNVFLKMCAGRVGQLINLQSLANDCGVVQNTIKSWLSVLESGFIIKKLSPYYRNFNKRLTKASKIYFYDTGLLCRLLSIRTPGEIATHSLKGPLFENLVFAEMEKHFFNQGLLPPLYFWRDKQGREIDFLIDEKPLLKTVEVKAGQTLTSGFFKNTAFFQSLTDDPVRSYLIYAGAENQIRKTLKVLSWKSLHQLF